MPVNDIILNENNDLLIQNGDFVINIADKQHQNLIFNINTGELKEYPTTGIGISKYIANSQNYTQFLRSEIMNQLRSDGFTVNTVNIQSDYTNLQINTDATI